MKIEFVLILSFIGAAAFPTPHQPIDNPEYRRAEGDIIPSDEDMEMIREKRGAPDTSNPEKKWPLNQAISYKFESKYDATFAQMIKDAFKFWEDNTCLSYQENGSTTPVIRIVKGQDCSSQLGRQSGASQTLNLDDGCNTIGTIIHEIGHSIGLGHTHMRSDRDTYVTINTKNLKPAYAANYNKLAGNTDNFGVEYDYSSVMHYGGFSNAIDDSIPVIEAKDKYAQFSMGQRESAAFSDIKMVNLFYNCAQNCPSPSVECQNGGIINSKTCNSCICPPMFTGEDCSERTPNTGKYAPDSCGGDLTATSSWQNVQGTMGINDKYWDDRSQCYWNIKAPAGQKIEIRLNKLTMWCEQTCSWNDITLFTKGFTSGGYKFCCPDSVNGKAFQSSDNGVSIRLTSAYAKPTFDVDYRLI